MIEFDYTNLLLDVYDTNEERIVTFEKKNLEKLEYLFKIRKRYKRILTEEQKEALRNRMIEMRKKKGLSENEEISDEDLEEELDSEDENDNEVVEE